MSIKEAGFGFIGANPVERICSKTLAELRNVILLLLSLTHRFPTVKMNGARFNCTRFCGFTSDKVLQQPSVGTLVKAFLEMSWWPIDSYGRDICCNRTSSGGREMKWSVRSPCIILGAFLNLALFVDCLFFSWNRVSTHPWNLFWNWPRKHGISASNLELFVESVFCKWCETKTQNVLWLSGKFHLCFLVKKGLSLEISLWFVCFRKEMPANWEVWQNHTELSCKFVLLSCKNIGQQLQRTLCGNQRYSEAWTSILGSSVVVCCSFVSAAVKRLQAKPF